MAFSREPRSASPDGSRSPGRGHRRRSRSLSKSRKSRSRSREAEGDENPGNNLYVTGLSARVTSSELERFFSKEGKVLECQVVTDPHTKESRGFGFVTMETTDDAERCIKHLNRAVLEGRLVTVEKAKRKRGRTPTPGKYQGQHDKRDVGHHIRRRSRSYSPRRRLERDPYPIDRRERDPYPMDRRGRDPYPMDRRGRDPYPMDRRGRDAPRFPYGGNRRVDDYSSYGGNRRADDYSSSYRRRGGY